MSSWMQGRYLDRLGVDWTGPADLEGLCRLHRAHLEHVPFENLSIHLGEPIVLDEVEIVAKIVVRRRGGFCYELNGGFAWLLRSLGYRVDFLEAGVFNPEGQPGRHFDHMVLRVHLADPWLADVGFGDNHLGPLPLATGVDHLDPSGLFRLLDTPASTKVVDLWRHGVPQYRLSLEAQPLSAFEEMCRFHQTPPTHFTQNTICSLATARGRVTLRGRTLIVSEDGRRQERELESDDEIRHCYRDSFGLDLPLLPPV